MDEINIESVGKKWMISRYPVRELASASARDLLRRSRGPLVKVRYTLSKPQNCPTIGVHLT